MLLLVLIAFVLSIPWGEGRPTEDLQVMKTKWMSLARGYNQTNRALTYPRFVKRMTGIYSQRSPDLGVINRRLADTVLVTVAEVESAEEQEVFYNFLCYSRQLHYKIVIFVIARSDAEYNHHAKLMRDINVHAAVLQYPQSLFFELLAAEKTSNITVGPNRADYLEDIPSSKSFGSFVTLVPILEVLQWGHHVLYLDPHQAFIEDPVPHALRGDSHINFVPLMSSCTHFPSLFRTKPWTKVVPHTGLMYLQAHPFVLHFLKDVLRQVIAGNYLDHGVWMQMKLFEEMPLLDNERFPRIKRILSLWTKSCDAQFDQAPRYLQKHQQLHSGAPPLRSAGVLRYCFLNEMQFPTGVMRSQCAALDSTASTSLSTNRRPQDISLSTYTLAMARQASWAFPHTDSQRYFARSRHEIAWLYQDSTLLPMLRPAPRLTPSQRSSAEAPPALRAALRDQGSDAQNRSAYSLLLFALQGLDVEDAAQPLTLQGDDAEDVLPSSPLKPGASNPTPKPKPKPKPKVPPQTQSGAKAAKKEAVVVPLLVDPLSPVPWTSELLAAAQDAQRDVFPEVFPLLPAVPLSAGDLAKIFEEVAIDDLPLVVTNKDNNINNNTISRGNRSKVVSNNINTNTGSNANVNQNDKQVVKPKKSDVRGSSSSAKKAAARKRQLERTGSDFPEMPKGGRRLRARGPETGDEYERMLATSSAMQPFTQVLMQLLLGPSVASKEKDAKAQAEQRKQQQERERLAYRFGGVAPAADTSSTTSPLLLMLQDEGAAQSQQHRQPAVAHLQALFQPHGVAWSFAHCAAGSAPQLKRCMSAQGMWLHRLQQNAHYSPQHRRLQQEDGAEHAARVHAYAPSSLRQALIHRCAALDLGRTSELHRPWAVLFSHALQELRVFVGGVLGPQARLLQFRTHSKLRFVYNPWSLSLHPVRRASWPPANSTSSSSPSPSASSSTTAAVDAQSLRGRGELLVVTSSLLWLLPWGPAVTLVAPAVSAPAATDDAVAEAAPAPARRRMHRPHGRAKA